MPGRAPGNRFWMVARWPHNWSIRTAPVQRCYSRRPGAFPDFRPPPQPRTTPC